MIPKSGTTGLPTESEKIMRKGKCHDRASHNNAASSRPCCIACRASRWRSFLPLHFLALATALNGAKSLDAFLAVTRQPVVACAGAGIVVALAIHMTLGLRVLAIEFFDFREKTLVPLSLCIAAVLAVGLIFIFNLG